MRERELVIGAKEWVTSGWSLALSTALLLLAAACGGDDAATPDASPDADVRVDCEQLQQELQEYANDQLESDGIRFAGLVAGVDTPECGTVVVGAGLANVDPETPMTPDHMLTIASISKTFVATRVLQLVEEGELSLDDTLSNWWPDMPYADSITIRELLNHTSGVPDYANNGDPACLSAVTSDLEHEWTIEEILACNNVGEPSAPGVEWSYSNTNYVFLGSIVEAVTGNALHEEIRSSVLTPLGLDHTFTLWYEEPPGDLSRSYRWNGSTGSWVDVTDDSGNYSFYYGCGHMASNAPDLLAWGRALSTGTLLQATTLDEMTDCVDGTEDWNGVSFTEDRYGLGIVCGHDASAGEVRGHGGFLDTGVSQVWHSPSWDSSVVFQANHSYLGTPTPTFPWFAQIASDLFAIVGRSRGF